MSHLSVAALALAGLLPAAAVARTLVAPPPSVDNQVAGAAADNGGSDLDEIVVTAAGRDKRSLDSSMSVTTVSADTIETFRPSSKSEALRLIPGIQVAARRPGGNSNIAVRGLPVATGGSPFVQLRGQACRPCCSATCSSATTITGPVSTPRSADVQAVRGGGARTFASQAPGAVINYISHYGEEAGGFAWFAGLGFDEQRIDARYGGPIGDSTRFHIGGYVKRGRGRCAQLPRQRQLPDQGQHHQDLNGDAGYIRLLFKVANTQEPNYTGARARDHQRPGCQRHQATPGFDGRRASNYSIYNKDFLIYDRDRMLRRQASTSITTNAKAIQAQFHYDVGNVLTIDNNARYTDMKGEFAAVPRTSRRPRA
ncbi:TonB-dependent receptor plug domain-containing protein [Sphingomonas sp. MMS24-JH45]